VLTAAALDATGIGSVSVPVPVPGSPGMVSPHRPSLARDCVRHVGDPVALVVAGSEAEARDAAELVEVDCWDSTGESIKLNRWSHVLSSRIDQHVSG